MLALPILPLRCTVHISNKYFINFYYYWLKRKYFASLFPGAHYVGQQKSNHNSFEVEVEIKVLLIPFFKIYCYTNVYDLYILSDIFPT
jgi:hypothetical protein